MFLFLLFIIFLHTFFAIFEIFVSTEQFFEPKNSARRLEDGTIVSAPLEDLSPFLPREELEKKLFEVNNTLEKIIKIFYICVGFMAFLLGTLGVILPAIPTVPYRVFYYRRR